MEATQTTTELVQLVETSGLEKTKQNQISETLGVFFNKASEWDATIKSIVITSIEETGKMKMAKEGRLTLKNMRLEAEKIVKAKRDEVKYRMANDVLEDKLWLKAGQMMEATFKNLETKLEEKEKFAERWEAEQKEKLKAERTALLLPLGFDVVSGIDLGSVDEKTFNSIKTGLEAAIREREEAERKRLEEERIQAEEREKMRLENERLKIEAEAKEKQLAEERAKAESEHKAMEAKAAKAKAESDAKIKAEREAKEKLEAEIKSKQLAEEKVKKDAEARAAAELKAKQDADAKAAKAPKKEKLNLWISSLEMVAPTGLEKDVAVIEIVSKFNSFKTWATSKVNSL